jgi:outer membrane protein OmpA-like peptidoglycan-associated protein
MSACTGGRSKRESTDTCGCDARSRRARSERATTPIWQGIAGIVQRSAVTAPQSGSEAVPGGESPVPVIGKTIPASTPAAVPKPETCPPPKGLACAPAPDEPGTVTDNLPFAQDSSTLSAAEKTAVDATARAWRAGTSPPRVRVDGYASAEGACDYNWGLSCRRAQTVAAELSSPSDGSVGVPATSIDVYAHGESDAAGPALAVNRHATISVPVPPPPTPTPSTPACAMPVTLGVGRTGCGSGTDFTHFDFPSISTASAAKLAGWAAAHGSFGRSGVSDAGCLAEMDGVLVTLGGMAGHSAFARFAVGTGGTETHGAASTLGSLALVSGSFATTVAAVKADIETQLSAQAAAGALDACALKVTPPATAFSASDGMPLKAVIGGTHGERLIATSFAGSAPLRTYSMTLLFILCDNFGVDEADLYAPGLFPFWVLQHERSPSLYAPFINELDLPVTVSGTF